MRIAIAALVCALGCAQQLRAEERAPAFDFDLLSKQPGVELSERKDGSATISVWSKNGVSVTRTVDGAKTTVWANDNTSQGAIICSWGIYVAARSSLEMCPGPYRDLKQDLDQSIALIDAFIVENSLEPITLNEVHAREEKSYSDARQMAKADQAGLGKLCSSDGIAARTIVYFDTMSREQRRQRVTDLLAVPRWAVLNPCM